MSSYRFKIKRLTSNFHGYCTIQIKNNCFQALGDSEGFGEQIERLKDFEFNRELEEQFGRSDPRLKGINPDFSIFRESLLFNQGNSVVCDFFRSFC